MTKQSQDAESHNKPCTLCGSPKPVLVRCQIDETGKWHFVCPGKCWNSVSGGEIDAKGHEDKHPHYRYGGMWKNRHADGPLNAKKPKKKSKRKDNAAEEEEEDRNSLEDAEEEKIPPVDTGDFENSTNQQVPGAVEAELNKCHEIS